MIRATVIYTCVTCLISVCCLKSTTVAQSVCLPLPRLLTTMPMGGKAGTQVELAVAGEYLDGAGELRFTHPGLTAAKKLDDQGQPVANHYTVSIAGECPPGIYEARLMTRLGISSARVFSVGNLPEVTRTTSNTTVETAMELPVGSICNAAVSARSIDHYRFEAKQGHRYIVNCSARGIDSKLDAVVIIADDTGRDLLVERRGGTVDFVATQGGKHVIKVHELTFKGGPEYFYRLSLQQLPADAPLPVFASTKSVSSFSWPPAGLAENAEQSEVEPNQAPNEPQAISLPCDIAGNFFPAADVDSFQFQATKGDVWWIEVASERLGLPTNPAVLVQRVSGEGADEKVTDVAEFSEIASPMKPSSNGYAYDGPPYDGGSADILGKLEIKEDGLHRLQLTDLFGGTRSDPRNVYRLIIRKAAPDFALAAWGLHMELRNGDRNALSKPIALRGGTTMALEVAAVRRDGFDGEIELVMEGLPDGVTAQGLKIPAGKSRGIMLITADQDAPAAVAEVSFFGRARLGDAQVTRPCTMAAMAWPVTDAWSEIPRPRLLSGLSISVTASELAPLTIAAEKKVWEAVAGQKLTIPLVHKARSEFSGSVLQLNAFGEGFESMPRFDVSLTAPGSEAVIDLATLKTPPGEYLIAFYGAAVAKYRYNVDAVAAADVDRQQAEASSRAVAEEVQRLTAQVQVATDQARPESVQALAAAVAKQQTAVMAVTAATEKLKQVTAQAAAKDTVDIVVAEPIAIRVKPAETP